MDGQMDRQKLSEKARFKSPPCINTCVLKTANSSPGNTVLELCLHYICEKMVTSSSPSCGQYENMEGPSEYEGCTKRENLVKGICQSGNTSLLTSTRILSTTFFTLQEFWEPGADGARHFPEVTLEQSARFSGVQRDRRGWTISKNTKTLSKNKTWI